MLRPPAGIVEHAMAERGGLEGVGRQGQGHVVISGEASLRLYGRSVIGA